MSKINYSDCQTHLQMMNKARKAAEVSKNKIAKIEKSRKKHFIAVITAVLTFNVLGFFVFSGFFVASALSLIIILKEIIDITNDLLIEQHELYELNEEIIYFGNKHIKQNNEKATSKGTFKNCISISDVKKLFKEKAKTCHPDKGGDIEAFQALNTEYQNALKNAKRG